MRFFKSNFAKKLIIILIILMIANVVIPKEVKAWDLGGILMKPITSIILANLIQVDVAMGLMFNGLSVPVKLIGGVVELFTEDNAKNNAVQDLSDTLGMIFIGPDAIFSGKVKLFDANIFTQRSITDSDDFDDLVKNINNGINKVSSDSPVDTISDQVSTGYIMIEKIREAIASTYVVLRDICGFVMLAGLIFTGIKILISSNTPTQAAAWRAMLFDWFVGMALLIFSHVIMVGIFYISDVFTTALSNKLNGFGGLNFTLVWQCLASFDSAEQIICLIMLAYMIYLTVVFAISYFKRLMWICVLVLIAPIVSVMYAFGPKTKQIYSKWLREYVMTVLIQPFHVVIYYALCAIPLNIVNSTGGFSLASTSILEIVYALAAMSFIRPAEAYIRSLFGFNQGIAEKASYDSGKKTMQQTAKIAVTTAGIAATAGVGSAVAATLKGGAFFSKLANVSKATLGNNKVGRAAGHLLDIPEKALTKEYKIGEKVSEKIGEKTGLIDSNVASAKTPAGDNNNNTDNHDTNTNIDTETKSDAIEEQNSNQELNNNQNINNQTQTKNIDTNNNTDNNNIDSNTSGKLGNLTADNITINGNTISLIGNNDATEGVENDNGEDKKIEIEQSDESSNTTDKQIDENSSTIGSHTDTNKKKNNNDEDITIGNKGEESGKKKKIIPRMLDNTKTFMQVATGNKGMMEALGEADPNTKLGQVAKAFSDSELGESLKKFEDLGGVAQLHEGFNELRNGFFVTPPPDDWKTTNETMKENDKQKIEKMEINIQNQQSTKEFLLNDPDGPKLQDKMEKIYKGKSKEYINDKAKTAAEEKAKSLTKTYVPLGIYDIKDMVRCEEDRKEYGYTAKEAATKVVKYNKFNLDSNNINTVNYKYGVNAPSVSEAYGKDPDDAGKEKQRDLASVYYNNGYTDIANMELVRDLTRTLNVSTEYGMKLDQILRKKGGKINIDNADMDNNQKRRLDGLLKTYQQLSGVDEKKSQKREVKRNNPENIDS